MNVSDVMSRDVVSVYPSMSLGDAVRTMVAHHLSGLPVVSETDGTLVGMVTEGDLLRRVELGTDGSPAGWFKSLLHPSAVAEDYVATHSRRVDGVMARNPLYVTPDTPLADVVKVMQERHFKRLPVLEDNKLVGMIGRAELIKMLIMKLIEAPVETMSDAQILEAVQQELKQAKWAPKSGLNISVEEQVVTVAGTIFSESERLGVITLVENVSGVKNVIDDLVFVDPGSGLAFPAPGV